MEKRDYIIIDPTPPPEPTKAPLIKKDDHKDAKVYRDACQNKNAKIDKYSSAYQYAKKLKTRYRC